MLPGFAPVGFTGFGRSLLGGSREPASRSLDVESTATITRRALRQICCSHPGVYGMVDDQGQLIYIGKSRSLRQRLLSYFYAGAAGEKAGQIIERTARIVWEPISSELGALVRELELIRRWQPRFNVQGQPGRSRRAYICLGRAPAPYLSVAAQPSTRTELSFGPLPAAARLREAVRRLNDYFGLRDCPEQVPMVLADQRELFSESLRPGCLRYEIGTCLGPCVGACTRAAYRGQVRRATSFLDGTDRSPLSKLMTEMRRAAELRKFEQAATLRDLHQELGWVAEQLDRLAHVRRSYSFIYPLPGFAGRPTWLFIRGGTIVASAFAPRNERDGRRRAKLIDQVYVGGAPAHFEREDHGMLLLIGAWFRRYPAELEHTIDPLDALRHCQRPPCTFLRAG